MDMCAYGAMDGILHELDVWAFLSVQRAMGLRC